MKSFPELAIACALLALVPSDQAAAQHPVARALQGILGGGEISESIMDIEYKKIRKEIPIISTKTIQPIKLHADLVCKYTFNYKRSFDNSYSTESAMISLSSIDDNIFVTQALGDRLSTALLNRYGEKLD